MFLGFADDGWVIGMVSDPLDERPQSLQLIRPRLALRSLFLGVGHGPKAEGLSPHQTKPSARAARNIGRSAARIATFIPGHGLVRTHLISYPLPLATIEY
jgi:hypothetical protein